MAPWLGSTRTRTVAAYWRLAFRAWRGAWLLATDWAPYGEAMRRVLDADERFVLTSTDPAPDGTG